MAMNNTQVAYYLAFKTRREYVHVALTTASLLSTVLKTREQTTLLLTTCNWFIAIKSIHRKYLRLAVLDGQF
jgi:hypothetical protein